MIELLIAISVLSLLAAVILTVAVSVRSRARDLVTLSDLSSHAHVFASYTGSHRDSFPYFTQIGAFSTTLEGGGVSTALISYFDAHETWHIALTPSYYSGLSASSPVFHPRWVKQSPSYRYPRRTAYHYPCVFIAHPEFWDQRKRTGPEQFGPTFAGDVTFPASKTLLVTLASPDELRSLGARIAHPSAFVDGSARVINWQQRADGYPRGDGLLFRTDGAVHFGDGPPLLHTIDGVRGRDLR